MLVDESALDDGSPLSRAGRQAAPGRMLGGRWALTLGGGLLLLLAFFEAAHWQSLATESSFVQIIQQPVSVTTPAVHPELSAPDPGDNP